MREVKIEWFGHSCFRVTKDGYAVVFDPYEDNNVPGSLETLKPTRSCKPRTRRSQCKEKGGAPEREERQSVSDDPSGKFP